MDTTSLIPVFDAQPARTNARKARLSRQGAPRLPVAVHRGRARDAARDAPLRAVAHLLGALRAGGTWQAMQLPIHRSLTATNWLCIVFN